ncbi:MAG: rhodanese-like domain-containing protein [Desulfuromonadales bacterium]|nr:rhodanese-like domain-containing protein [Desulfuromonadales bacterium]
MRSNLKTVLFFAFWFWGAIFVQNGLAQVLDIEAAELKKLMDTTDIVVIYPLSPLEFDSLHIVGSINIPLEELETNLPANKAQRLAFYCLGRT